MSSVVTKQASENDGVTVIRRDRQPVKDNRKAALDEIRELLERNIRLAKLIRTPLDLRRSSRK